MMIHFNNPCVQLTSDHSSYENEMSQYGFLVGVIGVKTVGKRYPMCHALNL